ncbi:MAG: V-type ATP synthase subunit F [Christensenellaceae bacterium]|jgi:V/A-type H+-transporting ATPase subunit F|nr:V-type ATP synthase subunit F [Christensenellaceae bacterium]
MADKRADIAIIGDRDSVLLAKAVGLRVFDETDADKVSHLIHRLARQEYKVIFITEPLFAACGEAVEKYKTETYPAIIPIPDSHGASGVSMANIKANVEKAIGTDILFAEEK